MASNEYRHHYMDKSSIPCQRNKVHRHTAPPIKQYPPTSRRFDHVHLDLIGPLPHCQSFSYCMTMIDRCTRWLEAVPLQNIEATTIARAFLTHWISREKVSLKVKEGAKPIFCKPKPISFLLKEKINQELDELENRCVVTLIENSEWGTPLVLQ